MSGFSAAPSLAMDPNTFQVLDPSAAGGASFVSSPAAFMNPYSAALAIIGNLGMGLLQRNILNAQDSIAMQDLQAQRGYQQQINDALSGLLDNIGKDSPAKAEAASLADYRKALDAALPAGYGSADANYGKQYSSDAAAEQTARYAQAFNLAGQLAKVNAPRTMRRDEGYAIGNAEDTANKYRNFASGRMQADRLLIQGTRPDPLVAEILGALRFV